MSAFNINSNIALRDIIGNYMVTIGERNNKTIVVNADLMGTCRTRTFVEKYPERSFNVGIAEQNLVSFSAGLAHEGFIPYAFSMAPFISMRACEQCRTDVAYSNLNVRLIATYAGCSGGISGATHWALEDCAIMGTIANMTVLEPSDPIQAKKMLEASVTHNGPIYMRSTIIPVPEIYDENYKYQIGVASIAKNGNDGAFICSGITVKYALIASNNIEEKTGKKVRVVDMHTIKPVDKKAVVEAAKTGNIVVAQDHNKIGGLGFYVADVLAGSGISFNYANLGMEDIFSSMAHPAYLHHKFGYDAEGLEKAMMEFIK